MATVLLTRRIPASALSTLQEHCTVDLHDAPAALTAGELKARLAGKQGLLTVVTDKIDAEVLAAGTELKVVANIAVGYDNIDVPAAAQRGVIVTNTPDVLTEATAELTWALILSAARRERDRGTRRRSRSAPPIMPAIIATPCRSRTDHV